MNWQAEDKYADIIHLPHHVSRNHPQMSMADRASSPPLLHSRAMTPQFQEPLVLTQPEPPSLKMGSRPTKRAIRMANALVLEHKLHAGSSVA